jgi:integrase
MPSIRSRADNNLLFFDFRHEGARRREQTLLVDNLVNRKKIEKVLAKIESEITAGTFVYANYFPNSKALARMKRKIEVAQELVQVTATVAATVAAAVVAQGGAEQKPGPLFKDFASQWVDEHSIEWRRSHIRSLLSTLNGRLMPHFGAKVVGSIS